MTPSDGGPSSKLSKVGVLRGNIPPVALCLNHSANRSDHLSPQAVGRNVVVGHCPLC